MYKFSQQSLDYFHNVHPKLVEIMKEAIIDSPFDFKITAGSRTAKEQNELYQQGRTRKGIKVTNCDGYNRKSNHQIKKDGYGHAVDIFLCGEYKDGKYVKFTTEQGYNYKRLSLVAKHIKEVAKNKGIDVKWGGNWKNIQDSPHFEI